MTARRPFVKLTLITSRSLCNFGQLPKKLINRASNQKPPASISICMSPPASHPGTYLDKLLAEPFEPFTFSPAGAVYQLDQFGTAAKKLKEFDLKP
jgi:hypothetical protein